MFFIIGPSARSLIAYMSEASLKKGPAWVLSTTLDAGRYGCGSSIVLIIYAMFLRLASSNKRRRASSENTGGIRGEEPLFLIMSQPIFRGGWGSDAGEART